MPPAILEPEFLRPADVERLFRIRRGHLYRLISRGVVRSCLLKERGKIRGVRLVDTASIRAYILSCEVVGSEATDENSTK